jgi:hypothetical protein
MAMVDAVWVDNDIIIWKSGGYDTNREYCCVTRDVPFYKELGIEQKEEGSGFLTKTEKEKEKES